MSIRKSIKNKKKLGQFFTTNSCYILDGMEKLVKDKNILDPFAGKKDLLNWAFSNGAKISGLDIDDKMVDGKIVKKNNSLMNIPYSQFILTNPPYLGKNKMNKSDRKKIKNEYEDLYMLSIEKIIQSNSDEGILIIPINFLSAENSDKIRVNFLSKYKITQAKYFTEQVFDDTTYNVICFHFQKHLGIDNPECQEFVLTISPSKETITVKLCRSFNFKIGGEEINDIINSSPRFKCVRLTEEMIKANKGDLEIKSFFNDKKTEKTYSINQDLYDKIKNNCIMLNVIDTSSNPDSWINAENIKNYNKEALVGKISSRNIAFLIIEGVPLEIQQKLIEDFNFKLNYLRKKYHSLFLTNFRDNNRKRVSFEFCYKLLSYCYSQL